MTTVLPPSWMHGRVWYHVHALGALAAPADNVDPRADEPRAHRLRDLVPWLDHLVDLGVGGLLLTPVFASETHGYDTVDPYRVDQRLGDEDDLVALVAACQDRGLRILLDGVFNHVGRGFPQFADVVARGRDSEFADWFRLDFDHAGPDGFRYASFEGHRRLVALDHGNPAVVDWAVDVACHWLDRGIDGWRLDAAYAVPTDFWARFAEQVRSRHPDAYLVGEVIHGDYPRFVRRSGLHAVTQYELRKSVWSALNDANFHELAWALTRHRDFCDTFVPMTFLGNHDVTRLRTVLDDPFHLGHALAVLFTVPGTPSIYYGDELGFEGRKEEREGGDDAIRPPLPAHPGPVDDDQAGVFSLYRHLVAVRRARPWLDTARLTVVETDNEHLQYRVEGDEHALLVALNAAATPTPLAERWHAIAGSHVGAPVAEVPPGGWVVAQR